MQLDIYHDSPYSAPVASAVRRVPVEQPRRVDLKQAVPDVVGPVAHFLPQQDNKKKNHAATHTITVLRLEEHHGLFCKK